MRRSVRTRLRACIRVANERDHRPSPRRILVATALCALQPGASQRLLCEWLPQAVDARVDEASPQPATREGCALLGYSQSDGDRGHTSLSTHAAAAADGDSAGGSLLQRTATASVAAYCCL